MHIKTDQQQKTKIPRGIYRDSGSVSSCSGSVDLFDWIKVPISSHPIHKLPFEPSVIAHKKQEEEKRFRSIQKKVRDFRKYHGISIAKTIFFLFRMVFLGLFFPVYFFVYAIPKKVLFDLLPLVFESLEKQMTAVISACIPKGFRGKKWRNLKFSSLLPKRFWAKKQERVKSEKPRKSNRFIKKKQAFGLFLSQFSKKLIIFLRPLTIPFYALGRACRNLYLKISRFSFPKFKANIPKFGLKFKVPNLKRISLFSQGFFQRFYFSWKWRRSFSFQRKWKNSLSLRLPKFTFKGWRLLKNPLQIPFPKFFANWKMPKIHPWKTLKKWFKRKPKVDVIKSQNEGDWKFIDDLNAQFKEITPRIIYYPVALVATVIYKGVHFIFSTTKILIVKSRIILVKTRGILRELSDLQKSKAAMKAIAAPFIQKINNHAQIYVTAGLKYGKILFSPVKRGLFTIDLLLLWAEVFCLESFQEVKAIASKLLRTG